jgi:ATP-dependent Lon protease
VAKALNKTFVRISLGGVRDEAEIRGHRRTYVGAMPGRIAQGLHQAKVRNPLMLLDEIDKTSSDYKGDIASALLEVLDSAENYAFEDHYVEVPIDLSDVLFIATANDVQNIPRPLLDRMELIEINSYTDNEKFHIAKEHLVPRQISANGLKKDKMVLEDEALEEIISAYTKEAGVRSLERQIGRICRKAALQKAEEKGTKETVVRVTKETLKDYLGKPKYHVNPANPEPETGIVRGLAWTSVGGDTLEIEVNVMPGKGEFLLTGQLGDVMKESAQTGISYLRSAAGKWKIPEDFFGKHDIHIHIPGRGSSQRRSFCGNYHGYSDALRTDGNPREVGSGHDRGNHSPGPCASYRRIKRKAPGGQESRHPDGSGAGQKPPGRRGTGCGNHTAAGYPFCQQHGPGSGLRPGAEVKEYFQVKLPGGCDFLAVFTGRSGA